MSIAGLSIDCAEEEETARRIEMTVRQRIVLPSVDETTRPARRFGKALRIPNADAHKTRDRTLNSGAPVARSCMFATHSGRPSHRISRMKNIGIGIALFLIAL